MRGDPLGPEEDRHVVVVAAHDDALVHEVRRYGVEVAVEADAEGLGDGGGVDVVGVEGDVLDGAQGALLVVLEDQGGDLAGDLVHAVVGEGVAPGGGLDVEVEQVRGTAAGPEALADEADRALDATLLVAPADVAGDGRRTGGRGRSRGSVGLKTVASGVCDSTTVFMLSKMSTVVLPPKKRRPRSMQRRNEPIAWLSVNSMYSMRE